MTTPIDRESVERLAQEFRQRQTAGPFVSGEDDLGGFIEMTQVPDERAIRVADTLLALRAALDAAEAENKRLREPQNAAACIITSRMKSIAPAVLNAVQAEREKWEQNPAMKRGEVPQETITLSMFEACLRAIAEIKENPDG